MPRFNLFKKKSKAPAPTRSGGGGSFKDKYSVGKTVSAGDGWVLKSKSKNRSSLNYLTIFNMKEFVSSPFLID